MSGIYCTSPQELDDRVHGDLALLNYPPANWTPATDDGISDVVIIGGGMCGMVAWFALARAGVRNVRIVDRANVGREGPWIDYARMETLRSPKQLLGPAFGMSSLTFQAWYRARFGAEKWDALYRIPRPMWMEYLVWYRRVLSIPTENGIDVARIVPRDDGLFTLELVDGGKIVTRKVVMATGRNGLGDASIPEFMANITRHKVWAHSSDPIDFAGLRGKRVVVIGVGASAVDNAAEALEAGAGEVRLLARRPAMPTINKMMGIGSYGVVAGWPEMSPEWRWKFMNYSVRQQTPAPHGSTLRVSRHANAYFHFNCGIRSIVEENGGATITTVTGRIFHADFVILGTGFDVKASMRPEIAHFADRIACWQDRYTPPAGEENLALGLYPWLERDFGFSAKVAGDAPWLADIHCFNYAAALSIGKVSGDIPAISEGAQRLARGIAASFFQKDIDKHWQDLLDYAQPELDGSEWTDADAPTEVTA